MDSIGLLGVVLVSAFLFGYSTAPLAAIGIVLVAVSYYFTYKQQQHILGIMLLFAHISGSIVSVYEETDEEE